MSIVTTGTTLATPRPELADAYYQMTTAGTFIADKVLPQLAVDTKAGQLEVLARESMGTMENLVRSPDGSYARTNARIKTINYSCAEIGGEHVVLDGDGRTISYNRELGAVNILRSLVDLKKEAAASALLFSGWAGTSGNAAVSWATAASAKPIDDIVAGINTVLLASGVMPNALIVNPATLQLILGAADTKARFPGAPMISQSMLQQSIGLLTGLEYVFVGGAVYSSLAEGRTWSGAYVWPSTDVLICRVAADAGPTNPMAPSTGRTAVWTEDASLGDLVIESYRDETRRGQVLRARTTLNQILMDAATGLKLSVTAAST